MESNGQCPMYDELQSFRISSYKLWHTLCAHSRKEQEVKDETRNQNVNKQGSK